MALRRGPLATLRHAPASALPAQHVASRGVALRVACAGVVVGFLTGCRRGFIIVPALVLGLQYELPSAVGTSLLIISLNSAVALLAGSGSGAAFHWAVIAPFTVAAIAGAIGGKRLSDRISGAQLTRSFAVLLLLVACYVLGRAGLG